MISTKIYFLLYIFLIHFIFVEGQQKFETVPINPDNTIFQQLIGEAYFDPIFTNKGIYFRENFHLGKIVFGSKDSLINLQLRYNCYTDQLIWLSKIHGQIKLDKSIIKDFEIWSSDTVFQFRQTKLEVDSMSHFYQICYEGKVQLYVQRKVKHYTDYIKKNIHYYLYKPNPQYYLVINEKAFYVNRVKIKSIYILFPELKERIQDRVKQMSLKDKKESDFIYFIKCIEDLIINSR